MHLDCLVLNMASGLFQKIVEGKMNTGSETALASVREDWDIIQEIYGQFKDIELGHAYFHKGYFQERIIVTYWAKSLHQARQLIVKRGFVTDKTGNPLATKPIERAEDAAVTLSDKLLRAASQGSLTRDMLVTIEERWARLDEILSLREQDGGKQRRLESWYILNAISKRLA